MTDRTDADRALFTSGAYAATPDAELESSAAAWLETQSMHPFIQAVARRSLAMLALRAGESVLDMGCGTGVLLPALGSAVGETGRVVGLDHSAGFLAQARERVDQAGMAERSTLVDGDANRLPFDDASFDAAHTERVLMHLEDPDVAVRELRRVVRPGGRVVCAEIYARGAIMDSPDPEAMEILSRSLVSGLRNPHMGLELRRRMVLAGLTDVRVEVVTDVEHELDLDEAAEFREHGQRLAEQGLVDRARADAVVDSMLEANDRGMHSAIAIMFVAIGRVAES